MSDTPMPTPDTRPPDLGSSPWWVKAGVYVLEKHGVPLFFTLLLISWMVVQANWERQDRLAFQKVLGEMTQAINRVNESQVGLAVRMDTLQSQAAQLQATLNVHAMSDRSRR